MSPTIRKAVAADLPTIYDLVLELAIFEKEPDALTASIDDYYKDFEAGIFEAHVAEVDGKVVGTMVYYMTFSTWKGKMLYLEDFVVSEAYRKLGLGQLLFDALIEEGKRKEVRLIKWQVLDWNTSAIAFYEKNKAIIERNWWTGKRFLT